MCFEIHGDGNNINYMKGKVPEEILDKFFDLKEDIHLYQVGKELPRGEGILWHSQEMAEAIRAGFEDPSVWDRVVLDNLIKKRDN